MEKKKTINVFVILLLIIGFLAFNSISSYNHLVVLEEGVNEKFSKVQTAYQRRADLIPNFAEIVKQYASHENEVFTNIAKARSGLINADSPSELQSADNFLTDTLKTLFSVVEAYPELKANENFMALQDELAGTENRIKVERDIYNQEVKNYNIYVRTFPNMIYASIFHFEKKEMFDAKETAQDAVEVKEIFNE